MAAADPYASPPAACVEHALAEGASPEEALYHAGLACWRYRRPDGSLDQGAMEARIAALHPAIACRGADPARLDAEGDHPVHRNERAGLRLALDIDAGLAPELKAAVLLEARERGLEMRQARETTGIDTTHISVQPDGSSFVHTRSAWIGLDSPRIPLGFGRGITIARTSSRRPPRRSIRKAARHAHGRRRRSNTKVSSRSSGSSGKPGEPGEPPPPAQLQRWGREQDRSIQSTRVATTSGHPVDILTGLAGGAL